MCFPRNKNFELEYKACRNKVRSLLRQDKDRYFKEKIEDCEGSSKKLWMVLNEYFRGNRKKCGSLDPEALVTTHEGVDRLSYINRYFALAGQNIVSSEVGSVDAFKNIPSKFTDSSFEFRVPSISEIRYQINSLKINKASGDDRILNLTFLVWFRLCYMPMTLKFMVQLTRP